MTPEKYVYELPDGYVMKPQHREKLDGFVKEHDLTNVEAQGLIDLHVELVEEFATEMQKAMVPTVIFFVTASIIATAILYALITNIF